MKINSSLLFLLFFFSFSDAFAQNDRWIYIGTDGSISCYLDRESITVDPQNSSLFYVWGKFICQSNCEDERNGKTIIHRMYWSEYEISNMLSRNKACITYYVDGSSDNDEWFDHFEEPLKKIIPETFGEDVCKKLIQMYGK